MAIAAKVASNGSEPACGSRQDEITGIDTAPSLPVHVLTDPHTQASPLNFREGGMSFVFSRKSAGR